MTDKLEPVDGYSIDVREELLLAPFAMHSQDSSGRKYAEREHPYRSAFQRDRDRVLHSAAFRRLSGKMQVFTGDRGDYHRTRLTHTMEVASIARTIGRRLRLNEDLIEALALLHDIGHPPFGHAGEDALDACLAENGGFSHNRFALTLVEELEQRYHQFPGLNLTYEVLAGQAQRVDKTTQQRQLLEAQVVDVADSITYNAHDVDDALKLGLVHIDQLAELPLVDDCAANLRAQFANIPSDMLRQAVVHELVDCQVSSVLRVASPFLATCGWQSHQEALAADFVVGPDEVLAKKKVNLEQFLYEHVYRHEELLKVRRRAQQQLTQLFETLVSHPDQLPELSQRRADVVGLPRAVADHLAGMTDRFCRQQYDVLVAGKNTR